MREELNGFRGEKWENKLIQRFEKMRSEGNFRFLDVSEFEEIIDTYLDKGQLEKAEQTIHLALQQHPSSVSIRLKKAELLISTNEDEQALNLLNTLVPLDSQNYQVYLFRGSALARLGHEKEAVRDYDRALSAGMGMEGDIAYQAGTDLELIGRYNLALNYMKKAYHFNPYDTMVLFELGFLYRQLGYDKQAVDAYKRLLEEDPFNETAWSNIGEIYLKLEKHEEALEAFDFQLAIHRDSPEGLFNKGRTLMLLGRYAEAIGEYRIYVSLAPHDVSGMTNLGKCYRETGELSRALSWYKMVIEENPKDPEFFFQAAGIYELQGKWQKAESFCSKAINLDRGNAELWYELFRIAKHTGSLQRRIDLGDRVVNLAPDHSAYWLDFLMLLFDTGEKRRLEVIMKQAFKYHPDSAEMFYMKAAIRLFGGKTEEGANAFEKALSMDFLKHKWFLEKFPELNKFKIVHELIQHYKPE